MEGESSGKVDVLLSTAKGLEGHFYFVSSLGTVLDILGNTEFLYFDHSRLKQDSTRPLVNHP